jgi:hypothetical protein
VTEPVQEFDRGGSETDFRAKTSESPGELLPGGGLDLAHIEASEISIQWEDHCDQWVCPNLAEAEIPRKMRHSQQT